MKEVEIVIPSSPADRKAIADGIKEMSNSMARIEGEQAYIKESIDALKEKFNLDAKYLRKMLTDFHKDQFDKVVDEAEQYGDLYDAVFNSSGPVEDAEEVEPEDYNDEAA